MFGHEIPKERKKKGKSCCFACGYWYTDSHDQNRTHYFQNLEYKKRKRTTNLSIKWNVLFFFFFFFFQDDDDTFKNRDQTVQTFKKKQERKIYKKKVVKKRR